jgi:excisionase family DNA binding protein
MKVRLPQLLEQKPWLKERYVRRLVAERRIPFYKVGNCLVFETEDFDRLLEAGRVEPPRHRATV